MCLSSTLTTSVTSAARRPKRNFFNTTMVTSRRSAYNRHFRYQQNDCNVDTHPYTDRSDNSLARATESVFGYRTGHSRPTALAVFCLLQIPFAITAVSDRLIISDWGLNAIVSYTPSSGEYQTLLDDVIEPTAVVYSSRVEVLSTAEPGKPAFRCAFTGRAQSAHL